VRTPRRRRAHNMDMKITTLEGKEAGSATLSKEIVGLEARQDLVQRCVNWQLAKRQAGTHKAKGRAEIWRTGKKMYKQKGTGGARHGSAPAAACSRWCASRLGPCAAVPRWWSRLWAGRAQPCVRSAEEGSRPCASACSVGEGQ